MDDLLSNIEYDRQYAFASGVVAGWAFEELLGILHFMLANDQGREGNWGAIDAVIDEARRLNGSGWLATTPR